ncbi:MAG: spore photoproduct lyase family protein [Candidatus Omnitrophota bacterium]
MKKSQKNLKIYLEKTFNLILNKNQFQEIDRLIFEIMQRDSAEKEEIINNLIKKDLFEKIKKSSAKNKFSLIKNLLIEMRFPLTAGQYPIKTQDVFLSKLNPPLEIPPKKNISSALFTPEKIFVEKKVKNSYLSEKFKSKFPRIKIQEISYAFEYIKKNKFNLKDLKKPYVFIVREQRDFIKPCPCTKNHLGCGYWIFNLGFGCPYDCAYCFLQQYANFPGIMLPANFDDFFADFDNFYKKINRPIRIGTGEFCDSLALDDITEYSSLLIDFFREKNVLFELKTKSNNIANILKSKPAKNIIISFSVNPQSLIDSQEFFTATLQQRIQAAKAIQEKSFSLAFHFDPIIYTKNWQSLYQEVIDELYKNLKTPFMWISLGTLRGTRTLKNVSEVRFPEKNIFYGELFLGPDKKLRYPKFLRKEIYKFINSSIRKYDQKTPVYLCMEDQDCWSALESKSFDTAKIEDYLINPKKPLEFK